MASLSAILLFCPVHAAVSCFTTAVFPAGFGDASVEEAFLGRMPSLLPAASFSPPLRCLPCICTPHVTSQPLRLRHTRPSAPTRRREPA
eukprot:2011401-Rhodomonas_salina.1